ncbi:ribose-phosphate pyrophosphokinase [Marinobacter salinus]|uniref:ribose-phosphate diphosphokinase n=1 Tax=Marinobacter salinus TaxID=1874317 RepID=A0A1D9GJ79_9GAMM|nr:ribose-phosphate pyrophosphokinase [Marinobacter salinus]AOY87450.1 ribose-phosphate pyrophosphokinase [Marinobacter salinus]
MAMELSLFTLNASHDFGIKVAEELGITPGLHEEREFVDGEHKSRPLENVRGRDVYVIQSLYSDDDCSVNDKLVRLLWFIGSLRDAAAGRITAVLPYLCYARKDRKTKPRDPVSTRYMAAVLEAVGIDCVITLDVHNLVAYQNAFRINSEHLDARKLFASHFSRQRGDEDIVVVSPDVGGVKRAELFRQTLEKTLGTPVGSGFMEKHRSAGTVAGERLVAEVEGRSVIIVDDLISSGGTLSRTVRACKNAGASRISAAVSHGVFVAGADEQLADPALEELVVTDTIPPFRVKSGVLKNKLVVLGATSLFAKAIRNIHEGGSVVELLEV